MRVIIALFMIFFLMFPAFAETGIADMTEETFADRQDMQVIFVVDDDGNVVPMKGKSDGTLPVYMSSEASTSTVPPIPHTVYCTLADTEYSQVITDAKRISFQNRAGYAIRYAYVTGKVAGSVDPYWTLKPGSIVNEDNLGLSTTIYFASSTAGQTVEMQVWK